MIFLGYGGLGLSIEGPSKVDINCDDLADGVCKVSYTPQEPGDYIINVKFADKHVPGSPFTVKCSGNKLKFLIVYHLPRFTQILEHLNLTFALL